MAMEVQASERRSALPRRRAIILSVLALLLVGAGGFIWLLFQPTKDSGPFGGIGVGQAAPNFTLTDSAGHPVTLSSFRGHPVIINFWASYCSPCRGETPLLQQLYNEHQAQGLVILGINEGEPASTMLQYMQDYQITYPVLADRTLQFNDNNSYDPVALPRTFFIDKEGIVRAIFNGQLSPQGLQADYQRISG
jgi:cytochrome c biogenesis protein CcmG/thiol:disulfide interchange protein DsbE